MSALRDAYEVTSLTMIHFEGMAAALDLAWDNMDGVDHTKPPAKAMGELVRDFGRAVRDADAAHRAEWEPIIAAEDAAKARGPA